MRAEYWQKGETLDYLNESGKIIEANEVIDLKTRIGVAGSQIAIGEVGTIHMSGVFKLPLASGGSEIAMGKEVYYSEAGMTITKGSNTLAGYAIEKTPSTAKHIMVKLLG